MIDIIRPIQNHLALFEKAFAGNFTDNIIPDKDSFVNMRGKYIRPVLFFLCQGLVGNPRKNSVPLAVLIELLHTASLVHDDVVDGAKKRRGRQSYNVRNGSRISILTGDYLLAKALSIGVSMKQGCILPIVSRTLLSMTRGELRQNVLIPAEQMTIGLYYQIIQEKTASLFAAACEFSGLIQKATALQQKRLRRFGEAFGTAFQIRDDILDFTGKPARLGKAIGLDLRNRQMTLPLLLAVEKISAIEKKTVLSKMSNPSVQNRKWIVRLIQEQNGVRRAVAEAGRCAEMARNILLNFPPSVYRKLLEQLLVYDGERTK